MTFMKVCGITRASDAHHAITHGASALGFVFWPQSPRYIAPDKAAIIISELQDNIQTVGVFVDQSLEEISRVVSEAGVSMVQLHGDESSSYAERIPLPLLKAMTLENAAETMANWPEPTVMLLDANDTVRRGGTGKRIDWTRAAAVASSRRVILAGGLTDINIEEAITTVRPYGVDVSSGVEDSPGVKNLNKLSCFLERARGVSDDS
tara:strand:- start:1156 stop:1776 length:621 start_codon:yes stop_codon:yes gene_type:complete